MDAAPRAFLPRCPWMRPSRPATAGRAGRRRGWRPWRPEAHRPVLRESIDEAAGAVAGQAAVRIVAERSAGRPGAGRRGILVEPVHRIGADVAVGAGPGVGGIARRAAVNLPAGIAEPPRVAGAGQAPGVVAVDRDSGALAVDGGGDRALVVGEQRAPVAVGWAFVPEQRIVGAGAVNVAAQDRSRRPELRGQLVAGMEELGDPGGAARGLENRDSLHFPVGYAADPRRRKMYTVTFFP
jgi:hypothetical protein